MDFWQIKFLLILCAITSAYGYSYSCQIEQNKLSINCEEKLYFGDVDDLEPSGDSYIYCDHDEYGNRHSIQKLELTHIEFVACLELEEIPKYIEGCSNLQSLNLASSGIVNIDIEWSNIFPNLKNLCLDSNKVAVLRSLPPTLVELNLQANSIRHLSKGPLSELRILKSLNLNGNQIESIQPETFTGLVGLKSMDLSNNAIITLLNGTFNGLGTLEKLNLHHNYIRVIESSAFSELTNLTELDLSNNGIETIPNNVFQLLGRLQKLLLQSNHIVHIEKMTFFALSLRTLNLERNFLAAIYNDTLEGLSSLTDLNLESNNISAIDSHAFEHFYSLKHLKLGFNHIGNIRKNTFKFFRHIQQLNMCANNLSNIESGAFGLNLELADLDLSRHSIAILHNRTFEHLFNMKRLLLNNNKIELIESMALAGLCYLQELNLSENIIRQLNNADFSDLRALKKLDLSNNQIKTIEPFTFNSTGNLTDLNLSHNNFTQLPVGLFAQLVQLQHLDLSHAKLEAITIGTFARMKNLASLKLSANKLAALNFALFAPSMPTLKVLFLDDNYLTELTTSVDRLFPGLESLDFSRNRFSCAYLHDILFPSIPSSILTHSNNGDFHAPNVNGINCVENNGTEEEIVKVGQMTTKNSNKDNIQSNAHGLATQQRQNITHIYLQDTHSSITFFIVANVVIIILMVAFIGCYVYSNRQKICYFHGQMSSNVELNDVISIISEGAFLKTT